MEIIKETISSEYVIRQVCEYYDINYNIFLDSRFKYQPIPRARQITSQLLIEAGYKTGEIAEALGLLDCTISDYKKLNLKKFKTDSGWSSDYKEIIRIIIDMTMKEKLDKIFSRFIRLRDSNEDGYGKCISCSKILHWKKAHAGHYINRKHMSTRYNEKNVNLQCVNCNTFEEGNPIGYTRGLMEKYGDQVLDILQISKNQTVHYTKFDYETLIKHYNERIKQVMKSKNFEL